MLLYALMFALIDLCLGYGWKVDRKK